MKRIILFPLPIAIIVYFLSSWWLGKYYLDIEQSIRTYIAIGAALLSGVISYFLFQGDAEELDAERKRK